MKGLFIVNPSSGRQNITTVLEKMIGKLVLNRISTINDVFFTKGKDDAFYRAKMLQPQEYDFVVAVGGDGTVNEVIGGLIESHSEIPLAIIPAGTVNDFATYLNLPRGAETFVRMIQDFQTIPVDIGCIGHQYFANVVAGGAFSDISFRVPKTKKAKLGPLAYYIEGALSLPELFTTSLHLKITADDKTFEENAILFMISNTKSVGGFKQIAGKAEISDGLFDMIVIRKCELPDLIALSKDILLNKHFDSPFLHYFQAHRIEIDAKEKEIPIDIDGEPGPGLPLIVENIPQALHILVPKKGNASCADAI